MEESLSCAAASVLEKNGLSLEHVTLASCAYWCVCLILFVGAITVPVLKNMSNYGKLGGLARATTAWRALEVSHLCPQSPPSSTRVLLTSFAPRLS
jgi:hypothetical protein